MTTAPSESESAAPAARFVPSDRAQRTYVLSTLVTSIGTGLYSTGSIVFFVHILHLTAGFLGVCLTVASLVGLLASLPAGRLADRLPVKRVMVALFGVQALLFALFPLVRGQGAFLVIVVAIALAQTASVPVRQVFLSDIVGAGSRVAVTAYNRSVLNVGLSIGALLGAAALAASNRAAYDALLLGNALSFLIAGALLTRVRMSAETARTSARTTASQVKDIHPLRQPRLVAAAIICGILYLSAAVLDIGLPLQVAQHSNAPPWMIGFLFLINTILVVVFQVRASRGSDTLGGAARGNRTAGIALLGACIVFPLASHRTAAVAVVVLIAATILLTAGEMFSSAGSWGLSYGLAPADQQGKYLASFAMVSQLVQVAGPVLAAFVVSIGPAAWVGLGIVFAVSGCAAPLITRKDSG